MMKPEQLQKNIERSLNLLLNQTEQISSFISTYKLEQSDPQLLINNLAARKKVIDELNTNLEKLKQQAPKNDSCLQQNFRKHILPQLQQIIELDEQHQIQIHELRELAKQKSIAVKNGRKFIHTYNAYPHRKAIFVNMAVSD